MCACRSQCSLQPLLTSTTRPLPLLESHLPRQLSFRGFIVSHESLLILKISEIFVRAHSNGNIIRPDRHTGGILDYTSEGLKKSCAANWAYWFRLPARYTQQQQYSPGSGPETPRSNICPRKNKSPLSLTTGRASLVSNRALLNRRRI